LKPRPARPLAAALVLASALLAGCAERLFFHPDKVAYTTPKQLGVAAIDVWFEADDGSRLHAWWLPAAGSAPCTVVHAHGNAANISNHLPLVAWLPAQGINVFTFDYRGYGHSEGQPSFDGVVADVQAALRTARQQPGAQSDRLVLFGQSLGGATAIRAVQRSAPGSVRGLILDSAFASYRGIARDVGERAGLLWLAPLVLPQLPTEAQDPVTAIRTLPVPVWLIHGDADAQIPYAHTEQLFAAAPSPKHLLKIEGGQHIDALMRPSVRANFLQAVQNACSPH
jgi:uncharacterized protein